MRFKREMRPSIPRALLKRPRIETIIAAVLGSGIVVLLVLTFSASRSFRYMQQNANEADRERTCLVAVQKVNRALLGAETAERGFLLTSKASYRNSYLGEATATRLGIAQARQELGNSPAQKAQLKRLSLLADAKLTELQQTIELQTTHREADALALVRMDAGEHVMDDIQQLLGSLIADERAQYTRRRSDVQAAQLLTERFFRAGETAMAWIFACAFLLIRKSLQSRDVVTETLRASEMHLKESEQMLRVITDNLPVFISYMDSEERVKFVNNKCKAWFGIEPCNAVGSKLVNVLGEAAYERRKAALRRAHEGHAGDAHLSVSIDGELRHLHTMYMPDKRPDGTVAGIFTLITDITAMKAAERHLDELARKDALTGLPNRRDFEEKLQGFLACVQGEPRPYALLFLDVDHFKSINDVYGHAAGDLVLSQFSSRLKASVRSSDLVARLAGDEFVVLLTGLSAQNEACMVAEKITRGIHSDFTVAGQRLEVTTSIGIAYATQVETREHLLACADRALYNVKEAGRDGFGLLECSAEPSLIA